MNQQQFDTLIQAVFGLAALAIVVFFVHQGALTATDAIPIVGVVLSAFGFAEVGRRQRLKRER